MSLEVSVIVVVIKKNTDQVTQMNIIDLLITNIKHQQP